VLDAGIDELADLRVAEGGGHRRAHRGPEWRPVSADSPEAMSIARTGAPQPLIAAIASAATPRTGALSPVPEEGIDDGGCGPAPAREASTPAAVVRSWIVPRRRRQRAKHARRIALHLLGPGGEPDLDRDTRPLQVARHDEAVAAVVAPSRDHDHGPARLAEPLASTRARLRRPRSIRTSPGVPCSIVHRSSARISAA